MGARKKIPDLINDRFYEDAVRESRKYKTVVIFGAGNTAFSLYKKMKEFQIPVKAFWVSNSMLNKRDIDGIPVIQIDQAKADRKTTCVLLGVSKPSITEVEKMLRQYGFIHYVKPDMNMPWGDLEMARRIHPAIEITTQIGCSVNCKFCPQTVLLSNYFAKDKNRKKRLSLEDYKKCLQNLPDDTVITFSGFCEPFLNPECADMLCYTAAHGNRISLHTTLVGMNMEDFKKIKNLPFENIILHTPDKDHFANIPVTDNYLEVLDAMLDAKTSQGESLIRIANCQSEPDEKVLKFINHRVSFMNLQIIDRAGNINIEEVAEHISHEGEIICTKSPRLRRNVLLPDGSLVLCCMDFGLKHELGNLLDSTYDEIENGKILNNIRGKMKYGGDLLCRKCSIAKSR